MNKKILLLFAFLGLVCLQGKSANPKEYIWFGEQPYYEAGSYVPEFYIYNVGTKKFLGTDGLFTPGSAGTPMLYKFTKYSTAADNILWFIQNPGGNYVRTWYTGMPGVGSNYRASLDYDPVANGFPDWGDYALSSGLMVDTCGDAQVRGTVYKFRANQILATNWALFIEKDGSCSAQRINGGFYIMHDNTTSDNAKFLLISPRQYEQEMARHARMQDFYIDKDEVSVKDYMLNPNIEQTQGTVTYAPYGWTVRKHMAGNANITPVANTAPRGYVDTNLECWSGSSVDYVFDYYQKVTVPAGRYRLTAKMFVDGPSDAAGLYVHGDGVDESMTVTAQGQNYGEYQLDFTVHVQCDIELGVKTVDSSPRQCFFAADDFDLIFLSNTNATSPDAYWYGETIQTGQLDGEDRYYLYNMATGLFINKNVNNPGTMYVDDTAEDPVLQALKFSFSSTEEGTVSHKNSNTQSLYLGMSWELFGSGRLGNYSSYLTTSAFNGNILGGWRYRTHLRIIGPNTAKKNAYQFQTGDVDYHAFGVDKTTFAYKSCEEADEDYAWWLAISEAQYQAYLEYVRTYNEGLDILQNPEEWPLLTIYRDELIKWMNTPAQYNPTEGKDNVTIPLRDLINKIKAEINVVDPSSTEAGRFGTRCLYYDFSVTGANLYTVEGLEGSTLVLQRVESGKAGEPYIFQATESAQTFANTNTGYADEPSESNVFLRGVFDDQKFTNLSRVVPVGCYVLQTKDDGNGGKVQKFYKVTKPNSRSTAYRCYLSVPDDITVIEEGQVKGLSLVFRNETDALEEIFGVGSSVPPVIYDVNGRRIPVMQRGINIVNGHKVLVK